MSKDSIDILRMYPNIILDNHDEFKCLICSQIMLNPCYTPCCCEFCYSCIFEYLKKGNVKCPGTTKECLNNIISTSEITLNPIIKKKISNIKVKCPNKMCNYNDVIGSIACHVATCTQLGLKCPMFEYGCNTQFDNDNDLKSHMHEAQQTHIKTLISLIKQLKVQIGRISVGNIQKQSDNKSLENENVATNLKTEAFCPIIWEIRDWKKKVDYEEQIDKIFGPTFYSCKGEYKWRVGMCLSYHRDVYFFGQILPGEHDDVLEWPCCKVMRIAVSNQCTSEDFRSINVEFKNKNANKKPTTGENAVEYGGGCVTFDSLKDFPQVVVDDKMIVVIGSQLRSDYEEELNTKIEVYSDYAN